MKMRRINYKSDIPPLLLSLKVDEKQITVPDCDFLVRFYIEGYEGRHYDCSHIGGVWSNCEPSEDGTKLVCYINNQRLGIGELCAEFHYISPDKRYSDGSQKSVVIIDSTELGVELVEDNGDAVTEAAIDVTLPFIYRTAYEIARDHGYTGTAEDFYSALASVVGIADAEKKRVSAEITRNANEQERRENEENRLNAESDRVNAEAQRVRNEAIRNDAECTRIEQEEDRKAKFEEITEFIATVRANEGNRKSNERERQANEDARITEEAKRVEAEKRRATEFEQQKLDLSGKIDRSGDEMGGDLTFTDNAGVSFRTSDGGAHTLFNDTDDVAKLTADNGDTFEFTQENTPNKNSSAVVISANLYNALDMTLESMGSALDGDAAYRVEAGDTIFNPDTCKIQRYNSTIGGFEDLCDPIEGKLYANKMTGYIYRWEPKTKKMVFVGGVKAYTKDEADSRFAKLKDETQTVNVKELIANNFISTKSMWIGDEGLLLDGDGNGHLTVEQDEVITDVTLNEKLATKADDVAYMVDFGNMNNIEKTGTVKEATQSLVVAAGYLLLGDEQVKEELNSKIDRELHVVLASMGATLDNVDNTGDSTTMYVANVGDIYYSEGEKHLFYKKSEALTIDLGEPNDKKIYANAMTKRLYIWRGGTWWQCGTDAYTKAESDSRYYDRSATDTLFADKVDKTDISQSTGTSETAVMSQRASTASFIANTPSGDPMHNMYVEVGAIYNDTGKNIERVDQWGDTIIHYAGYWYLNGLGNLTNADMNRCWIYGNCIFHGYNFYISGSRGYNTQTNIPYISNGISPVSNVYIGAMISNWRFTTFSFNDIAFKDVSKVKNNALVINEYKFYNTGIIKYYGWIVCKDVRKLSFYNRDRTECIGLILTTNSYIDLPKLRADCIRQIIEAVRATGDITITLHPEAYERAIADEGVQMALANKTNVSLAKGE